MLNLKKEADYLRRVLDAIPLPVFVVDYDVVILDANKAAQDLFSPDSAIRIKRLCGEVLHCLHEKQFPGRCGNTPYCKDCLVRISVQEAWKTNKTLRNRQEMILERGNRSQNVFFSITASPFQYQKAQIVLLVLEDISELMDLRQIVPLCAGCKKIRNDKNYWETVESFISKYTNIDFSHSLCPDCAKKYIVKE